MTDDKAAPESDPAADPATATEPEPALAAATAGAPELIWLRPERNPRGPRPAHTRDRIAAAAITLGDTEGLAGVSMRKIAAALGAGTMSLYNYVPKKEHLFDLMLDAVAGEYDLPGTPSGDPRADLLHLAHLQLAAIRRHPWVPELVISRPSIGPNSLRTVEYFLAVLADTGQDGAAKLELFAMLNGFVNQFAQWETTQRANGGGEQWQADLVTYLTIQVATGHYPHLAATYAASAAAGVDPSMDPDAVFTRSLGRVVDIILGPAAR